MTDSKPVVTPRMEKLTYALACYRELVLAHDKSNQTWSSVRDRIVQHPAFTSAIADSAINELCKAGKFEMWDDGERYVKERFNVNYN
jgi:hypothetical protein